MARPHKMQELEDQHGDLDELIPKLLNELGSQKAVAERLGVAHSTINLWVKSNGYVRQVRYVPIQQAS